RQDLRLHHAGLPRGDGADGDAARHHRRLRPPVRRLRADGVPPLGTEPLPADDPGRHLRRHGGRDHGRPDDLGAPLGEPVAPLRPLRDRQEPRQCGHPAAGLQRDVPWPRHLTALISDDTGERQRNRIFAREGSMVSDKATETVMLRLKDGFIQTTDARRGTEYQTEFQSYDVNLDLRRALAGDQERECDPKEMALAELGNAIAAKEAAGSPAGLEKAQYQRRFSLPFACLVFGLVAVPLGIQPARGVRARGFAVSIVLIFCYYILLSAGQAMAEQRFLPAVIGLWLPNAVFVVFGA